MRVCARTERAHIQCSLLHPLRAACAKLAASRQFSAHCWPGAGAADSSLRPAHAPGNRPDRRPALPLTRHAAPAQGGRQCGCALNMAREQPAAVSLVGPAPRRVDSLKEARAISVLLRAPSPSSSRLATAPNCARNDPPPPPWRRHSSIGADKSSLALTCTFASLLSAGLLFQRPARETTTQTPPPPMTSLGAGQVVRMRLQLSRQTSCARRKTREISLTREPSR